MRECGKLVSTLIHCVHIVIWFSIQTKMSFGHLKSPPSNAVKIKFSSLEEPRDYFVCKDEGTDPIHFSLGCDKKYSCELTTSSCATLPAVVHFLDLKALTDDCQHPFNPNLLAKLGRVRYSQIEPFTISQHQILELTIRFTNFTFLPPNYFCSLTNLTKLTMVDNTFKNSSALGFSKRQCCSLQSLHLAKNNMEILNNASFCSFPNLTTLDLSQNVISDIEDRAFEVLENLLKLNISQNALTSLQESGFRPLKQLMHLDLSSNRLDETCFRSFQRLPNLQTLVLTSNKIAKLSSCHLEDLHGLKELYLNKNNLIHLGPDLELFKSILILDLSENRLNYISPLMFSGMEDLSELDLSQNNFTFLPYLHFSTKTELLKLNMSSNWLTALPILTRLRRARLVDASKNLLENITDPDTNIFCHMTMVESLILDSNHIRDIAVDAFHCNNMSTGLQNLSLNDNNIRTISGVFRHTTLRALSLNHNAIRELSLSDISPSIEELDISFNHIERFSGVCPTATNCNRTTALRKLNLSFNRLHNIVAIHLPINLQLLYLRSNDIIYFSFPEVLFNNSLQVKTPNHFEVLDLSYNNITSACPFIFYSTSFDHMPAFKLKSNPITCPCEAEFLAMREADFCLNPFKGSPSWPKQALRAILKKSTLNGDMLEVSKLRYLDQFSCSSTYTNMGNTCQCNLHGFYNSMCKFPCPSHCQCFLNSRFNSQFINCTHRNLTTIPDKVKTRIQIVADFSNNNLKILGRLSLASYASSKTLYLQHNRISEIHPAALQHVPELMVLNLSCNILSYLPPGAFRHLAKLTELYLSRNRLSVIPSNTFQMLDRLVFLTLDNNALTNLSVWDIQDPKSSRHFRLTLRDNPWSCKCSYVNRFRNWLQNYSNFVDDSSRVYCQMMDGSTAQVPMISFNSSHCYSFQKSGAMVNVRYWASGLAAILLLALICATGFTYRKEVQVIIYCRFGIRLFSKLEDNENNMIFDAFIAYSCCDEDFVMGTFVPGLEQIDRPYRVCIHQRNFLAGAMIAESILEAIDKSRRTIIILSKHFVSSGWCRFEFKSAHMKMLTDRCSRVIVVILDSVPEDLDSEMKLYVNTNTYLKWGDVLFWKKLYFAMPDRNPPSHQACNQTDSVV